VLRFAPIAVALAACLACEPGRSASVPNLPDDSAGRIVARAIEASGGWKRWFELEDVAFVTTFTIYDPFGDVASESIGLQKAPLHGSPRVRFESLGLAEAVTLGFDGKSPWMMRGGAPVRDPGPLAFARFNMVSSVFWFALPFSLAEMPVTLADLGAQSVKGHSWQRVKVTLAAGAPEAPGDWFVIYFDEQTGLIDHLLAHITASFLRHDLWVGRWLDFQDCTGIRKERRRQFYPADDEGNVIGELVVDQLVEDVRFNNHFAAEIFDKPLPLRGENQT